MNKNYSRAPVERRVMHPGNGWQHVGGAVWEHSSGIRVHLLGMVKLPTGEIFSATTYPHWNAAQLMIRINGGNRKRGLMAWAMTYNAVLSGKPPHTEL